jgi:hypothetical protein
MSWLLDPLKEDQSIPPGFRETTLLERELMNRHRKLVLDLLINNKYVPYQSFLRVLSENELLGGDQDEVVWDAIDLLHGPYRENPYITRTGYNQLRQQYYIYPWARPSDLLHSNWALRRFFITPRTNVGGHEHREELLKMNKILLGKVLPLPIPAVVY